MELNANKKNNFNVMQEPQMADELIAPEAEYEQLLALVKKEHSMFVARAKYHVPKMAAALERDGKTPEQIRQKIYADLKDIWAHGTIVNALPSMFKDHIKADNAKKRAAKSEALLTKNEQRPSPDVTQVNENQHIPLKQSKKEQVQNVKVEIVYTGKNGAPTKLLFEDAVIENEMSRLKIFYHEKDIHLKEK